MTKQKQSPGRVARLVVSAQETFDALKALRDAGQYVSPIAGAVATVPSVKHIRNAGQFLDAMDRAEKIIAKVEGK